MDLNEINKSMSVIIDGGVVVMPTDTVYGIVCSAINPEAIQRVFDIKKRTNKLGTLLFANEQQLIDFGFDEDLVHIAMEYWPGEVSVVLPAPPDKEYLTKGWDSLAVRVPKPKWIKDFLLQTGPLSTTSANLPDEPTVTSIQEAKNIFQSRIDYYLDGGIIQSSPSRIIRINENGKFEVLRGQPY